MRVLYVTSEVFPFSKTGGLGDISSFLPKGLHDLGHDITLITPYYQQITHLHDHMEYIGSSNIRLGGLKTVVHYFEMYVKGIRYIFVQNQHYFERQYLYGYNDDAERFTCFSYAVLDAISVLNLNLDIIHINDWQSAMIPFLLDIHYRHRSDDYNKLHTLLTIHNLQHQGNFDPYVSRFFNTSFNYSYMHFNRVNFLKAGIEKSTMINTVSPSYRNEVLTQEYGYSLDGALQNRHKDFYGILNGLDTNVFNPETDKLIHRNYNNRNFVTGKRANKEFLLKEFELELDLHKPLVSLVSRLASQKGIDLIMDIIEEVIIYSNANFIFMGNGEDRYERFFEYLQNKYPQNVHYYKDYNEKMAHQIYAGSDLFLMPSLFEPCGLGQMMAMKYGTLPIVRETGGLKDTVIPYNKYTGEGTGFSFRKYESYDLKEKMFEAIALYEEDQSTFRKLVREAMRQNFSNEKMALEYEALYNKIGKE